MVANGVFLKVKKDVILTVRNTTVFLLPLHQDDLPRMVQFELLQEPELLQQEQNDAKVADNEEDSAASAALKNQITTLEFFQPQEDSCVYALVLLVDERKLVHYDVNLETLTFQYRSFRMVPRNATCMVIAYLETEQQERKHVVIVGEKTGEGVAMPFPDISRDLKTLLGHTTSMITHMAVSLDSKMLLTGDRDEKIRVSQFPQTGLISSYCLGHRASLTKLACSTLTPDLVVSTSLDNTIKLWSISMGKLYSSQNLLVESDGEDITDIKTLLNSSLAICPVTNVVIVVVNYRHVRLFTVKASSDGFKLEKLEVSEEDLKHVSTNEPCEACFAHDGTLVVSYKKSPFVQAFTINQPDANRIVLTNVNNEDKTFVPFRTAAATIELVSDEAEILEELEDGLKKKKVKTALDWKSKLPINQ